MNCGDSQDHHVYCDCYDDYRTIVTVVTIEFIRSTVVIMSTLILECCYYYSYVIILTY